MPKAAKEEKELLESFEKGEWKSVKRKDVESKRYREYACSTFLKDRRVNIRISTKDLEGVRKKSGRGGDPLPDADLERHP